MNIEKLCKDFNIDTAEPGDKNYRDGWVNIKCPFCADHSKHLGFNDQGAGNCWRCGPHSLVDALSKILKISKRKAAQTTKKYKFGAAKKVPQIKRKPRLKAHKLPTDTTKLKQQHIDYLNNRKFNADKLEKIWNLYGTGPIAKLDNVDYRHRIIAPIFWEGEPVSFQARDITGKNKPKYKACPQDRELIEHQTILYGKQSSWNDTGICVEGITDVWRIGPKAFCTFGINYTQHQVRIIAKHFKRVIIAFDPELAAQTQAKKLKAELQLRNIQVKILNLPTDPGDLTERQVKILLRKFY